MPSSPGSIRLFQFSGIDVFLHWSWFFVAVYEISSRGKRYPSLVWNVIEYLALFVIVLLHEFGHALACRQVGGRANRIMLWPLGGVAYVDPPPRPGATLWSIAAGPLVNLVFLFILSLAIFAKSGWAVAFPYAYLLVRTLWGINLVLLIFNMLPIYPLDGGQILRALLWFLIGRARSLMVVTILGFAGAAGLIVYAIWRQSLWTGLIAAYMLITCWSGWQQARILARAAAAEESGGQILPPENQATNSPGSTSST
jgi:Zn-dependent protease